MSNKTESFIYFEIFLQILLKRTMPKHCSCQYWFHLLIQIREDLFVIFSVLIMVVIFSVLSFIAQLKKKNTQEPKLHYVVSNNFS